MVLDTIANLCMNGTYLIPAITLLRGIGAGLCGEPACFESYAYLCYAESNATMVLNTIANLCLNATHLIPAIHHPPPTTKIKK